MAIVSLPMLELFVAQGWSNTIGRVIHELMHALGFYHEHCRSDRDKYVRVESTGNDYDKVNESKVRHFGPYDFDSIMHYSQKQGVALREGINAEIGQRKKLSKGDTKALNKLYPPKIFISRLRILDLMNDVDILTKLSTMNILCMELMNYDPDKDFKVLIDRVLREVQEFIGTSRYSDEIKEQLEMNSKEICGQLDLINTQRIKKWLMNLRKGEKKILDESILTARIRSQSANHLRVYNVYSRRDQEINRMLGRLSRINAKHEEKRLEILTKMNKAAIMVIKQNRS